MAARLLVARRVYVNDMHRGFRAATRQPAVLASAALAIALGIASPTTIFSIVHGLSRDLPVRNADRIVYITQSDQASGERDIGLTRPVALAIAQSERSLDGFAAFISRPITLGTAGGAAAHYTAAVVTPNAFALLGEAPRLGTLFTDRDAMNGTGVAVISDAVWKTAFGGSPDILGRVVRINRQSVRVLGVMPPGFAFPFKDDVWQPLALEHMTLAAADSIVHAFGMLKPRVPLSAASAEIAAIGARVARDPLDPRRRVTTRVMPYRESLLEPSDLLLFRAMSVVVSLVLLVACANVANLFLANVAARGPSFAVSTALGASRGAIVREILVQAALAAIVGGVGGLFLAGVAVAWFNASASEALPAFWMSVSIDGGVLAYSATLVVIATVAAGVAPALNAAKADPASALREQSRNLGNRRSRRAARTLLALEVAVSCTLLIVAGVMTKGAVRGTQARLGVDVSRVAAANIYMDAIENDRARAAFISRLTTADVASPLTSIAFTTVLPGRAGLPTPFSIEGVGYDRSGKFPDTCLAITSPSLFELLHIRPLAGRLFDDGDVAGRPSVAIVNEAFARHQLGHITGSGVIGKRIRLRAGGDTAALTIVGVIPDIISDHADPTVAEVIVVPVAQHPASTGLVLTSGGAAPSRLTEAMLEIVRRESPDVAIDGTTTLGEALSRARRTSRSVTAIFAQCGLAGLILAVIGVYGVAATASRQRVHEVAIRRALGASAVNAAALVFSESAIPLAIGTLAGCALAFLVTPSLSLLLFGESPHDPGIFALVAAMSSAILILAGGSPAYQVAVAPMTELLR